MTHRGLSGPAALRLSAFKARELQDCGYKGTLVADLLPDASPGAVRSTLDAHKKKHAGATVAGATRPSRSSRSGSGRASWPRERPRGMSLGRRVRACVEINH